MSLNVKHCEAGEIPLTSDHLIPLRCATPFVTGQRVVLVCGGRQFANREALFAALDATHAERPITLLIHGAAVGADTFSGEWAVSRGVPVRAFHADWDNHKRKAGPIRNQQTLLEGKPDEVIAFPGERGTANMLRQAKEHGVPVTTVSVPSASSA